MKKLTEEQKAVVFNKYSVEQRDVYANWDPLLIFKEKLPEITKLNKVVIEIGSGNGDFLINLAENKS